MQNRGARFILSNYHRTASVSSMKLSLSLPSLSLRRKISRLCLFYKIYHSNTSLKDKLFLEPPFISPRFDHPFKVGVPHCNTSAFLNAFIPKTSLEWNHLPASFVNMPSIDLFKKALSAHLLSWLSFLFIFWPECCVSSCWCLFSAVFALLLYPFFSFFGCPTPSVMPFGPEGIVINK